MKIYIDLILILNFLFDILLIVSLGILLKRQTNLLRLILSALTGSLSIISLLIIESSILIILSEIIISIIMVIIAYRYISFIYTLQNIFYFYTISIFLGGVLYLININLGYNNSGLLFYNNGFKINIVFLLILSPLIIYIYIKSIKRIKDKYNNIYNVDIYIDDKEKYNLNGFLDTGNNLYDPYQKRPIILINKGIIKIDYHKHKLVLVPINTINNKSLLKCIRAKKICIDDKLIKTNFLIGISDEKINIEGVDCILHKDVLRKGLIK